MAFPADLEPLSPELVLVTPELRAEAIRLLPPPLEAKPYVTPAAAPSPLRMLVGTVEVTARVPIIVTLLAYAVLAIARTMLIVGGPVVVMVTLATVFGH
jgi:hypothetical protein